MEKEESSLANKIDKDKKMYEMGPKPRLPRNNSNKRAQIRESGLLRCKSKKCRNYHVADKTRKCLKLYNKLYHPQKFKRKIEELKERNYKAILKNRE